jgi:hypothetical protein
MSRKSNRVVSAWSADRRARVNGRAFRPGVAEGLGIRGGFVVLGRPSPSTGVLKGVTSGSAALSLC